MQEAGTIVSSRLLRTEVIRVLRHDRRQPSDAAPLLDRIGMLEISRETHTVAESIERHVRTLDALHLATALLIGDPVTVATHDATMRSVAGHLGFARDRPCRTRGLTSAPETGADRVTAAERRPRAQRSRPSE